MNQIKVSVIDTDGLEYGFEKNILTDVITCDSCGYSINLNSYLNLYEIDAKTFTWGVAVEAQIHLEGHVNKPVPLEIFGVEG